MVVDSWHWLLFAVMLQGHQQMCVVSERWLKLAWHCKLIPYLLWGMVSFEMMGVDWCQSAQTTRMFCIIFPFNQQLHMLYWFDPFPLPHCSRVFSHQRFWLSTKEKSLGLSFVFLFVCLFFAFLIWVCYLVKFKIDFLIRWLFCCVM